MFDYENFKIMHRHAADWVELEPHDPHDSAKHDIERSLGRAVRILKCSRCDEQIAVIPRESEDSR